MTREDVKKIFGENATDEQITNFLNNYQNEVTEKKKIEAELAAEKEKNSTLEGYKKQIDEINKSKMSQEEQIKAMKEEAEKNLKNSQIIVNTAKAKEILSGLNIDDNLLAKLVTDNEEETKTNANAFKKKMEDYKEEVTKQVTEKLLGQNVNPPASNKAPSSKGMTSEQFEKLSDDEKIKFAEEHPEEFENL